MTSFFSLRSFEPIDQVVELKVKHAKVSGHRRKSRAKRRTRR
jgi:hypothetical protein